VAEAYYRTGQAAKQLGVSSYHVRRLCEAGEIAAEISAGQQWKIPVAEIARLKRDGVPPVPVTVDEESADVESNGEPVAPEGLYANPSDQLIEAAEDVKIAENRLQKRRLERESEEVEDWFRERKHREAEQSAAARRQAEATQAEHRRQAWVNQRLQYALDSLPHDAPREVELDVHATVQQALAEIAPRQPATITTRLVTAAVEKALRPWRRKQEVDAAIETAMDKLDWDVRNGSSFAGLKQRAWDAAVGAIRKVREEASYVEMTAATIDAVRPMSRFAISATFNASSSRHNQRCASRRCRTDRV
jgi:excisionase family DNA binding protein